MKQQYVKTFSNYDKSIDTQINDYLREHPNYEICKTSFYPQMANCDKVLVVFNIGDPPTYSVARGVHTSAQNTSHSARIPEFENAKSIKDCERCKIREFCKDFADGGVHTCQEVYQIYLQSKENKG